MPCSKTYLCFVVGISLLIGVSFATLAEDNDQGKTVLEEGTKVHLEKDGKVALSLDSSMEVEKLLTEGKWAKVQITGWVPKSEIPKLSSGEEKEGGKEVEGTDKEQAEPIITGKAGPFNIRIEDINFVDKVEDRFGTVYRSGSGGSFLIVDLIAQNTNEGQEMNLYKTNIVLLDRNGRQYKSVGISNEESFQGGSINPEEARKGYLYFSVFDDSDLETIQIEGRPCSSCAKYKELFELGEMKSDTSDHN